MSGAPASQATPRGHHLQQPEGSGRGPAGHQMEQSSSSSGCEAPPPGLRWRASPCISCRLVALHSPQPLETPRGPEGTRKPRTSVYPRRICSITGMFFLSGQKPHFPAVGRRDGFCHAKAVCWSVPTKILDQVLTLCLQSSNFRIIIL